MSRDVTTRIVALIAAVVLLPAVTLAQTTREGQSLKNPCPDRVLPQEESASNLARPWLGSSSRHNFQRYEEQHNPLSVRVRSSQQKLSKRGSFDAIQMLPGLSESGDYMNSAMATLPNGDILVAYLEWGRQHISACGEPWDWRWVDPERPPKLWAVRTPDGGNSWDEPVLVGEAETIMDFFNLSMVVTSTGRILLVDESLASANNLFYSDDGGATWTRANRIDREDRSGSDFNGFEKEPLVGPIGGQIWQLFYDPFDGVVKYHRTEDGLDWTAEPETLLVNPNANSSDLYTQGIVDLGDGRNLLAAFQKLSWVPYCCWGETVISRSTDGGSTWSPLQTLNTDGRETGFGQLLRSPTGRLWYVFQDSLYAYYFRASSRLPLADIFYMTSDDGGLTWTSPEILTRYRGPDLLPSFTFHGETPVISFSSTRAIASEWVNNLYPGKGHIWVGSPGIADEVPSSMPPVVLFPDVMDVVFSSSQPVRIRTIVLDETGVGSVSADYEVLGKSSGRVELTREGNSDVWTAEIGPYALGDKIDAIIKATDVDGNEAVGAGYVWAGVSYPPARSLRFYVEPVHDVGNIGLIVQSSSVGPVSTTWPEFHEGGGIYNGRRLDAAGQFGSLPLSHIDGDGYRGRWPLQDAEPSPLDYLFQAYLYAIVPPAAGNSDHRDVFVWKEVASPIQSGRGKCVANGQYEEYEQSAQDFILSYRSFASCDDVGLEIKQVSHQWSEPRYDDYIIFDFNVKNTGVAGLIDSLYVTMYFDFDFFDRHNALPGNPGVSDDVLEYDRDHHLVFMHDSGDACTQNQTDCPPAWVGVSILPEASPDLLIPECPMCGVTSEWEPGIDDSFNAIPHMPTADHRFTIGVGPLYLESEADTTVSFGLVFGGSKAQLLENLATMRVENGKRADVEDCPVVGGATEQTTLPQKFTLYQNYPNPFNPSTTIRLDVPKASDVTVRVIDLLGREVKILVSGYLSPGRHEVRWDAEGLAGGLYLVRMESGQFKQTRKVVLLQ